MLPPRANQLTKKEREAILLMVDAFLNSSELLRQREHEAEGLRAQQAQYRELLRRRNATNKAIAAEAIRLGVLPADYVFTELDQDEGEFYLLDRSLQDDLQRYSSRLTAEGADAAARAEEFRIYLDAVLHAAMFGRTEPTEADWEHARSTPARRAHPVPTTPRAAQSRYTVAAFGGRPAPDDVARAIEFLEAKRKTKEQQGDTSGD